MNKETDIQCSIHNKVNITLLNDLLTPINLRYPTMYFNVKRIKSDLALTVGYRQYNSFHIRVRIPLSTEDTDIILEEKLKTHVNTEHVEDYIILLDLLMKREKDFIDYYAAKHRIDAIDTAIAHVANGCSYAVDVCSNDECL